MVFKNLLDKFRKDKLPSILTPELMDEFERLPVNFVRGEGSKLWDVDGNGYLDALAGKGEMILGHSHAKVCEGISLQANKLVYIDNDFHIQEQAVLAQRLCQISQLDRVLISQFPEESRHAVIDLVKLYAADKGIKRPKLVSNVSMAQSSLEQISIPINDIDALGNLAQDDQIAAVHLQTAFDTDSFEFTDVDYLRAVRDLCRENGWLLIADEANYAIGRSGHWLAYQAAGVRPDIAVFGRGLGNGLPISVCAATKSLTGLLRPGGLKRRSGGSPLICQVAITVLDAIEQEGLLQKATRNGEALCRLIQQHIGTSPGVSDIRSGGAMTVIEFEKAPAKLQVECLEASLVVGFNYRCKTAVLTPALSFSSENQRKVAETMQNVIGTV